MARKKRSLNPRDFGSRTDEDIIKIITEDMRRSENFQQPYFEKFSKFYKQYNCVHDAYRENGSNLFIPYIYNIVETALPKILASVFESKPFITYKPIGEDNAEKGESMTNLVYFQMKQNMKAATRLYEIYKSGIMYGTAISKQTWRYTEKTVMQRVKTEQEIDGVKISVRVPQEATKVTYDAPEMRNIPIESFFFDPAYTDIESSPYAIHEYFKEIWEIKEGARSGYYKNAEKIGTEKESGARKTRYDDSGLTLGDMHDGVRIWEYWTDDWLVTVANKSTVIRVEPNPFYHRRKPFVKWVPVEMPNEFYGKSMIETLVDLQAELNTVRNQRIDNVSLAINRMFLLNKAAGIDPSQLVSRPNGYIEVDDVDKDIKELVMSDVTSSAYNDEEVIKNDMDVTSGVHNQDRGQAGERRETATVATLLSSASSERFRMQILLMEEDPLTELGRQLAELNKQFLDDDTFIRITKEDGTTEGVTVSFDDIDCEFDIVASATATDAAVNKEIRNGQLIQLLSTALNNPNVNQAGLLREVFKEFGFKEFDNLIMEAPPVTEEEIVTEGEVPPADEPQEEAPPAEAQGLYPQMGGVGAMGQYLQSESV